MRQEEPETLASSNCPEPPAGVDDAPAWLTRAIHWAHGRGATDLHFFPSDGRAMLWVRIDGELREAAAYSTALHERMVARLKVLARVTDYDGAPVQEGRFSLNGRSEDGEARLSVLPTLRGEKAVVRLLGGGRRPLGLEDLGFGSSLVATLRRALETPQGLILAIGPSGCGKSTALYAMLRDLSEHAGRPVSILTVEDPVEQSLPFAAQIGADPARGLDFAEGLRALLRQDPEVIMIGEIRDAVTATAALQAALTGHRLLSSMHTLTPGEALVRLRQMGAPAYVIASALAGVLNVRLARLACPQCRQWRSATAEERRLLPEMEAWESPRLAESPGCEACLGSGHAGRTGVGEWLEPTAATASALQAAEPAARAGETVRLVAGSREVILGRLREGRLTLAECRRLVGLASVEFREEGGEA